MIMTIRFIEMKKKKKKRNVCGKNGIKLGRHDGKNEKLFSRGSI